MLLPIKTKQFARDQEKAKKQRKDLVLLRSILQLLIEEKPLHPRHCDHPLQGEWKGFRDCHVQNDWVLLNKIDRKHSTILFARLVVLNKNSWSNFESESCVESIDRRLRKLLRINSIRSNLRSSILRALTPKLS